MSIAKNIRLYRERAGMYQSALGEYLGVSAQAVSKWELGKAEPDTKCIEKMCKLFGITADKQNGVASSCRFGGGLHQGRVKARNSRLVILLGACKTGQIRCLGHHDDVHALIALGKQRKLLLKIGVYLGIIGGIGGLNDTNLHFKSLCLALRA